MSEAPRPLRVLITGMSGVGKSTVTRELGRRGLRAIDLDTPEWSEWVEADPADDLTPAEGRDWVWRTDWVRGLLSEPTIENLFVSGCAENMAAFYPLIDQVVLLSAPLDRLMERLSARPVGVYGNLADDRRKVAELIETVEPLLRAAADVEIDASAPLDVVVGEVLRAVADQSFRSDGSPKVAGRAGPGGAGLGRSSKDMTSAEMTGPTPDRTPPIDPSTVPPRGPVVAGEPARRPAPVSLHGRHVRIGPLDPAKDAADLYPAVSGPEAERLFAYLFDAPFESEAAMREALEKAAAETQAVVTLAIRDAASGETLGRASYMRIEPGHRCVEVGSILFSPALSRTPAATEAMYLMARHVFEDLGYRRYEWKCDALNAPSRSAALRLGFRFEGIFERHMIIKGRSRDTAWFAMTEDDWPAIKAGFEGWLAPSNFDAKGAQIRRLADIREAL